MKRVVIDLDDKYSRILSITAVGTSSCGCDVFTSAVDLEKGTKIKMVRGKDGKMKIKQEGL